MEVDSEIEDLTVKEVEGVSGRQKSVQRRGRKKRRQEKPTSVATDRRSGLSLHSKADSLTKRTSKNEAKNEGKNETNNATKPSKRPRLSSSSQTLTDEEEGGKRCKFPFVSVELEVCDTSRFMCTCYASPNEKKKGGSVERGKGGAFNAHAKYFPKNSTPKQRYAIAQKMRKSLSPSPSPSPASASPHIPPSRRMDDFSLLQTIKGADFSLELKKWTFPLECHDDVIKELAKSTNPQVV